MYVELIYYLILIPINKCAIKSRLQKQPKFVTKNSKNEGFEGFVDYPIHKHIIKLVLSLFFINQKR
jgi:hypothetical protein